MISRQPGVPVQSASGSSHSSHRQSPQASPALQRACSGLAPAAEPGAAPPAPAVGGFGAPPPPEVPPDAAGCPLPDDAPPEPAFGAKGMGSPLPSEPPTLLGPTPGAAPPSGTPLTTLSAPALSAPAGAAGSGTPAQPGSSQASEASWIPSNELQADAASRIAMCEPTLAVTPHHAALACRPCSRDLLFTRRRSGLWNFAFRAHHSIAPALSASALTERFERDHRGKKASSDRQSEKHVLRPRGRIQLSFAVPSVWCTRRR